MFNKLRHKFVRKGQVLVFAKDFNEAQILKKTALKMYGLKVARQQYDGITINGYDIRFISSQSYNIRGCRPEIVYWCCNLTSKNLDSWQHIDRRIYLSTRLNPIRNITKFKLDKDILSDDFKIKEYINRKSFMYKRARSIYINTIKNKTKYKLKSIFGL